MWKFLRGLRNVPLDKTVLCSRTASISAGHKYKVAAQGDTVPAFKLPSTFSAWNFITWIHLGTVPSKGNK